jgi:hypothetical protein
MRRLSILRAHIATNFHELMENAARFLIGWLPGTNACN